MFTSKMVAWSSLLFRQSPLVRLSLICAIGVKSDSAQTEQYEINFPQLRKVAKQVSKDCANAIVDSSLPVLKTLFPYNGGNNATKILANFEVDGNLNKKYRAFLSCKDSESNANELHFSLIKDDGRINESVLLDCILSVCDEKLLGLEDSASPFQ